MRNNPKLKWQLESGNSYIFTAPGAYVLSWPMPPHRDYDVVACVTGESAVPAGLWGIKDDPENLRREFQHFCPEVRELLDQIDLCVNWGLAELDPLETCRSENGTVVLLGDAFHAMIPHSGSGGNSAIEDGLYWVSVSIGHLHMDVPSPMQRERTKRCGNHELRGSKERVMRDLAFSVRAARRR